VVRFFLLFKQIRTYQREWRLSMIKGRQSNLNSFLTHALQLKYQPDFSIDINMKLYVTWYFSYRKPLHYILHCTCFDVHEILLCRLCSWSCYFSSRLSDQANEENLTVWQVSFGCCRLFLNSLSIDLFRKLLACLSHKKCSSRRISWAEAEDNLILIECWQFHTWE
jgi:hypothetical protein